MNHTTVIMGVCGSGKTTVGTALAKRLDCRFLEGDAFHPPANVEKMRIGLALDDSDRWPWLDEIGRELMSLRDSGPAVLACSALKYCYRERLRSFGVPLAFVYLEVPVTVLEARLDDRKGHYMSPSLLKSQLKILEKGDDLVEVEAVKEPSQIVEDILEAFGKL